MNLKGRSFLKLRDFTAEEILYLVDLAEELKEKRKKRTDKSESPFLLDFPAELIDIMDIKPKKREEDYCELDPL